MNTFIASVEILPSKVAGIFPGLCISLMVAVSATALGVRFSSPVMLFALLLGITLNFLYLENSRCVDGVNFSGGHLIRLGVALLGLRLTFSDVAALGLKPLIIVMAAVSMTIAAGMYSAKKMGFRPSFGVLTAGATAICGASAALAISAVLANRADLERDTVLTVAGVTLLGTICMIFYPLVTSWLGFDEMDAGIFIGSTIHDVAQVVGAGFSISEDVGNIASLTKLLRVACLIPVLGFIIYVRKTVYKNYDKNNKVALPWFVVAFALLVVVNSLQILPEGLVATLVEFSRWLLVVGIAAIGIKTSPSALFKVGGAAALLLVGEAIFLATLVALLLSML